MADASSIVQQNLLDAKARLVAQEQDVLAQLEQIRKGIASIDTTIEVVCSGEILTPKQKTRGSASTQAADAAVAEVNGKAPADSASPTSSTTVRKTTTRGRTKTAKPTSTRKTRTPRAAKAPAEKTTKASGGRTAKRNSGGWQSYLHDEFKDKALTEVVETVFSRSPNTAMSSSDLIDKIFTPEIPKTERTSARDRLLNILSIGVSENKWYRVKPGQYSVSKDAQ